MMDNSEAVEKLADEILDDPSCVLTTYGAKHVSKIALGAIQADPLAYVKPKPLEWGEWEDGMRLLCWSRVRKLRSVKTSIGEYTIGRRCESIYGPESSDWVLEGPSGEIGVYPNDVAAQAAAQEDLHRRIRELF